MTNPTEKPKTTREQQLISYQALGHLLAADLPAINWDLSVIVPDELNAQVSGDLTDDAKRDVVAKWAHFLGADVKERMYLTHTTVSASGVVLHTDVRVWCHVTPPPPDDPAA